MACLEARQESILSRLTDLKNQIEALKGSKISIKVGWTTIIIVFTFQIEFSFKRYCAKFFQFISGWTICSLLNVGHTKNPQKLALFKANTNTQMLLKVSDFYVRRIKLKFHHRQFFLSTMPSSKSRSSGKFVNSKKLSNRFKQSLIRNWYFDVY